MISINHSAATTLLHNVASAQSAGVAAGNPSAPAASVLPTVAHPAGMAGRAEGQLAQDLFSVTYRDANQIRMQIFERVGERFGIDIEGFDDIWDFARAVRGELGKLLASENSEPAIREIERELGLDELGVSLEQVINAMNNVYGEDNQALMDAIDEAYGLTEEAGAAAKSPQARQVEFDEAGAYRIL